jgi:DNA-binding SARP family transcriptional activator
VTVQDLGKVSLQVGPLEVPGTSIRRKVLALICFLVTRPHFAATREEVIEAMWPDAAPTSAMNSLNQSVYFLRRVFEPAYSEETTAGYVRQDADLIWLDRDLVTARSQQCTDLVSRSERAGGSDVVRQLSETYVAKFALDFAYEDWSSDFRDWLHVSYLRVIERQIRAHVDAHQFDSAVALARRAVAIEPSNEELELTLLRLLRSSGAHSAAAEQYSHYATLLKRDLGVAAAPIDDL